MAYDKLLSPMKIGNLEIKNRAVMTAMGCSLANFDGTPSDEIIEYYVERAKGGTGLIINEITQVDGDTGVTEVRQLCLTKDENIPAFKKMTDAVHEAGAKMFAQLHHPGRQTYTALNGIDEVVSASAQPCGLCQQPTRALTTEEVYEMINKFVTAGVRAKAGGYDGVEIHASHGYLLEQFISPYTNHRTDEFGGSTENRIKIVVEIVKGIKEKCGADYPVTVRMVADECLAAGGIDAKGIEIDESIKMCKILEAAGADALNVTVGIYETVNTIVEPNSFDEGWRSHLVKAIKDEVSIPVMGNAVIRHPEFAEKLLEEGNQDFISMGRTFLAEPEWIKKIEEGRVDEINKCISCLYCFETILGAIPTGDPLKCAVNPRTGHEFKYGELVQDGDGKTVVTVGAGPSGLKAAKLAADRGFKSILIEQNAYTGGQLNFADKPPKKGRIEELINSFEAEAIASGVEIRLDTKATVESIADMDPYAVIVATGGVTIVPKSIKGIDGDNVFTNEEILSGDINLTDKKIAVIGGRYNGLETAEFLAEKGNEVTVIEMAPEIGSGIYFQVLIDLLGNLGKLNVSLKAGTELLEVKPDCIMVKDAESGEIQRLDVDAVVLSVGTRSVDTMSEELKKIVDKVTVIGDAGSIGRIGDATRGAYEAVLAI